MRCRDGTQDGDQKRNFDLNSINPVNPVLSEKDFYPPQDNRYWESGVEDINGGDNFAQFAKDYFKLYEYEDEE